MPDVKVRYPISMRTSRVRRRVVLRSAHYALTIPSTDRAVRLNDIGADWQQIPRPGQYPLVRQAGNKLRSLELTCTFYPLDHKGGVSVERAIDLLEQMSDAGEATTCSYGPGEAALRWRITNVEVSTVSRFPDIHKIKEATITITLLQVVDERLTVPSRKVPPKVTPPKTKRITYVVKRGDSLSKIAARLLHDANQWPAIAKLNKIRAPYRVRVGQKLIVQVKA